MMVKSFSQDGYSPMKKSTSNSVLRGRGMTAAASNELYRTNLAKGQTGLSIAFDLPTQTGWVADGVLHIAVRHVPRLQALRQRPQQVGLAAARRSGDEHHPVHGATTQASSWARRLGGSRSRPIATTRVWRGLPAGQSESSIEKRLPQR